MMLCKADFEDLFPDVFPPENASTEPKAPVETAPEPILLSPLFAPGEDPAIQYGWPEILIASAVSAAQANEVIWKSLPAVDGR